MFVSVKCRHIIEFQFLITYRTVRQQLKSNNDFVLEQRESKRKSIKFDRAKKKFLKINNKSN